MIGVTDLHCSKLPDIPTPRQFGLDNRVSVKEKNRERVTLLFAANFACNYPVLQDKSVVSII